MLCGQELSEEVCDLDLKALPFQWLQVFLVEDRAERLEVGSFFRREGERRIAKALDIARFDTHSKLALLHPCPLNYLIK
jgi:hypothetical protein